MKIEEVRYFCITFADRKLYVNNLVSDLPDEFKIRVKDDRPLSSVIWHRGKGGKINFTDHEKPRDFNPTDAHLQWIIETIENAVSEREKQNLEDNEEFQREHKRKKKKKRQETLQTMDTDTYRVYLQNIVKDNAEKAVCTYTINHSGSERESWTQQYMEASGFRKDPNTPTPLIDMLAITRGKDKEWMVSKILRKSGEYNAWMGRILGDRQRITDQLYNCETKEDMDKIDLSIDGDPKTKRIELNHVL